MQKWDYATSVVPIREDLLIEVVQKLNEMGSHGWELVSVASFDATHRLYFKRAIT